MWEESNGGEARNQLSGWMCSRIGHLAATCYTWFDGSPPAAPVPEKTHSQGPAEWTAVHPSPGEGSFQWPLGLAHCVLGNPAHLREQVQELRGSVGLPQP